ncbi:MAG: hypothetical protein IPK31_07100 [Chitinophagaceae bacterium]|nr:hypothetical protein [Chitinophagaceae bacterium]
MLFLTTVAAKQHQGVIQQSGRTLIAGVLFGYFLDKQKVTKKKLAHAPAHKKKNRVAAK